MQIILLDKVANLGNLGDVVTVKAGYARNFLIPTKRARRATETAIKEFEARRAELEKLAADKLTAAQALGEKLSGMTVLISQKAGVDGRLFGSVTNADIADSLASVNLAKILLKEYWKKEVILQDASEDFRSNIKGSVAGIVIGDRALEQRNISAFQYDLATAWIAFTGLPFVFAAWVSNKDLGEDFKDAFNRANAYGIKHIEEVVAGQDYPVYDLRKYYTENISYALTDEKRKGIELFLEKLSRL